MSDHTACEQLNSHAISFSKTRIFFVFSLVFGVLMLSAAPEPAHAEKQLVNAVNLSPEAQRAGITVQLKNQKFQLGITPNALPGIQTVRATVSSIQEKEYDTQGMKRVGSLYAFELSGSDPLDVNAPLWISIEYTKSKHSYYVLKYWSEDHWEDIPTSIKKKKRLAQGSLEKPHAVVGVFKTKRAKKEQEMAPVVYTGKASWYNWYGAAMNLFPIGTVVEVTNVDTGAVTRTTIVSTGPFVEGRIIDLPKEVFAVLANPSQGVMSVSVKEVKDTL